MENIKKIIKKLPFLRSIFYQRRLAGSFGLLFVNFIFQRIFCVNGKCKYQVHFTSNVQSPERLKISGEISQRSLARAGGCYIQAFNGIEIDQNVYFAYGTKIISANHSKNDLSKLERINMPVRIGKNCWIGANAVILKGIKLGENTIIGAGAVVTKSFPRGNIVLVGIPARQIKK